MAGERPRHRREGRVSEVDGGGAGALFVRPGDRDQAAEVLVAIGDGLAVAVGGGGDLGEFAIMRRRQLVGAIKL